MKAPDALRNKLRAQMAARPSPTRSRVRRRGMILTTVAALVVLGWGLSKGPPWAMGRPDVYVTFGFAALGALAALATASWMRHAAAMRAQGARRRTQVAAAVAAAVAVTFVGASALLARGAEEASAKAHVGCGVSFGVIGVALVGLFVWDRRGSVPVGAAATGAVLAGVVASWLAVAVHARCRYADLEHVVAAHALPVAVLVAVGALVGARWLSPRVAPSVGSARSVEPR